MLTGIRYHKKIKKISGYAVRVSGFAVWGTPTPSGTADVNTFRPFRWCLCLSFLSFLCYPLRLQA